LLIGEATAIVAARRAGRMTWNNMAEARNKESAGLEER